MRQLEYAPTLLGFSSEPAERLAARIAKMAPKGLTRVVFTSGGSEANETVIRLVRLYWRLRQRPDKIKIVALNRAYHGSSTGAASLTGLPYFHQYYEPLLPGVVRMPRPFCYRCELGLTYPQCALACADELERIIEREGADTIGAFIAEPVQGVGGVVVPPPGYFERIRAICDKHEVLMVADEVITGFGRLGTRFGIERWKVVPDMIAFAKGVTSGYLPLGGVILKESIYQTLLDAGPDFALHHGFTYSGHPTVCAAGARQPRHHRARGSRSRASASWRRTSAPARRAGAPPHRRRRAHRRPDGRHRVGARQDEQGAAARRVERAGAHPRRGAGARRDRARQRRHRRRLPAADHHAEGDRPHRVDDRRGD